MADESKEGQQRGLPDGLRTAIERTFAATAGSAAETRERAQELLDEVARRAQEARDEVARRGQEARDASATATARFVEAVQEMRLVTRDDLREVQQALDAIRRRLDALESAVGGGESADRPEADPQVEAE